MKRSSKAFTLIELLIVVAIIAILAAIAVPNFLEAQIRSKVSRAKADMRSAGVAVVSYTVDWNTPPPREPDPTTKYFFLEYVSALSTPVAYLSNIVLKDPFQPNTGVGNRGQWDNPDPDWKGSYTYIPFTSSINREQVQCKGFVVLSNGPSRKWSWIEHYPWLTMFPGNTEIRADGPEAPIYACETVYDASNGTKSRGGIARYGNVPNVPDSLGN
jgi:prepilin-type N-terminal cleavage/methylation domain-containing protein